MNVGIIATARRRAAPAGTFLVGNNAAQTAHTAVAGDVQQGVIAQASVSGTANNIVLVTDAASSSVNFRLVVYAASSGTVIGGSLLGKCADQTSLGSGVNSFALLTPVSIVSGNWYAMMLHAGSGTFNGMSSSGTLLTDRWFSDTFSDGPLNPAPNGGLNSPNGRLIYLTT
jgi:hypothetical protein